MNAHNQVTRSSCIHFFLDDCVAATVPSIVLPLCFFFFYCMQTLLSFAVLLHLSLCQEWSSAHLPAEGSHWLHWEAHTRVCISHTLNVKPRSVQMNMQDVDKDANPLVTTPYFGLHFKVSTCVWLGGQIGVGVVKTRARCEEGKRNRNDKPLFPDRWILCSILSGCSRPYT